MSRNGLRKSNHIYHNQKAIEGQLWAYESHKFQLEYTELMNVPLFYYYYYFQKILEKNKIRKKKISHFSSRLERTKHEKEKELKNKSVQHK